MKTEYTVEIYDGINNDVFCLIVTMKNKQTFFIGIFKNREKKDILKGIFNIFTLPEFSHIEELKRIKTPVSDIFPHRNRYAETVRYSSNFHKSETYVFLK